jgi:hypothetical protein
LICRVGPDRRELIGCFSRPADPIHHNLSPRWIFSQTSSRE